jgi:opacity protein-like surface antigen
MRPVIIAIIFFVSARALMAQNPSRPDSTAHKGPRVSLAVTVGYAWPRSKDALTQFWKGGPDCAVSLLIRAAPGFWIGAGMDAALLWFRQSNFVQAYPSVDIQKKNLGWFNIYLLTRYGFVPGGAVHPYVAFAIGASRLSGAEYKEVVDSVRVTYYDIPARTRLALTFTGGLEIPVSRGLSLLVEGAARYVHNDENLGFGLLVGGGVRITL